MAHADFAGTVRRVCLAYLPGLAVGDFVITHMGYALTKLSEADAAATLTMMREYGVLDALPGEPQARPGTATPEITAEPADSGARQDRTQGDAGAELGGHPVTGPGRHPMTGLGRTP